MQTPPTDPRTSAIRMKAQKKKKGVGTLMGGDASVGCRRRILRRKGKGRFPSMQKEKEKKRKTKRQHESVWLSCSHIESNHLKKKHVETTLRPYDAIETEKVKVDSANASGTQAPKKLYFLIYFDEPKPLVHSHLNHNQNLLHRRRSGAQR